MSREDMARRRRECRLSLRELAEMAGVSHESVWRAENRTGYASTHLRMRLDKVLQAVERGRAVTMRELEKISA